MPTQITLLLRRIEQGDREAADQLFRQVEAELRVIAARRRQDYPPHLDAPVTLLIDEAFCRLLPGHDAKAAAPADRKAFIRFAATKIHNLLVDIARRDQAQKRGRDREQKAEALAQVAGPVTMDPQLLLDLQGALDRFEVFAAQDALVFRIRYFLDCSIEETSEILQVSASTVKRAYQTAKMWLRRELKEYAHEYDP